MDRVTNKRIYSYNQLHGLDWNTGESTMKDFIEYLILTIIQIPIKNCENHNNFNHTST